MIKQMRQQGAYIVDIATQVGCSERTVRRYLKYPEPPARKTRHKMAKLKPFMDYIDMRLAENVWNSEVILAEIRTMGYTGGRSMLRYYIQPTKGYPPSVFAKLPALVERAGNGISGGGSITAFYTVLTEGDDQQDPIADSARAILDGHIVLSRRLAEAGHYPAIDIEASISRAMTALITEKHYARVRNFKQLLSSFQRNRDLVSVGAYAKGSDPMLDKAISLWPQLEAFLQQGIFERADWEDSIQALELIFPQV